MFELDMDVALMESSWRQQHECKALAVCGLNSVSHNGISPAGRRVYLDLTLGMYIRCPAVDRYNPNRSHGIAKTNHLFHRQANRYLTSRETWKRPRYALCIVGELCVGSMNTLTDELFMQHTSWEERHCCRRYDGQRGCYCCNSR